MGASFITPSALKYFEVSFIPHRLSSPRRAEAVVSAFCILKAVHYFDIRLNDREEDDLNDLVSSAELFAAVAFVVVELNHNASGVSAIYNSLPGEMISDVETALAFEKANVSLRDCQSRDIPKASAIPTIAIKLGITLPVS